MVCRRKNKKINKRVELLHSNPYHKSITYYYRSLSILSNFLMIKHGKLLRFTFLYNRQIKAGGREFESRLPLHIR